MPSILRTALGLVVAAAVWAAPAAAQTLFAWPDTAVDVSRYTTLEECSAAVGRVRSTLAHADSLRTRYDTLPWNLHQNLDPAPPAVAETARRCGARYTAAGAPLDDYRRYMELFLSADRDSDAAALVKRKLAAVRATAATASEERAVVDSVVEIYMQARPARLAVAEALLDQRVHGAGDMLHRVILYDQMLEQADAVNDTAMVRRLALQLIAAVDSVKPADTSTEEAQHLLPGLGLRAFLYYAVVWMMGDQVRMDSLAHGGAAALARLERYWWHKYTGMRGMGPLPSAVGDTVPPIQARYWFPDSAKSAQWPRRGRVSLVVFLPDTACGKGAVGDEVEIEGGACAGRFAALRRLAARFPALQIIVVAHTWGVFSYAVMPSASEEAEWIRRWVAANAPAGITLAIDSAGSWHLPVPDSRRFYRPVPTDSAYTIGQSAQTGYGFAVPVFFLVDQDGRIAGNWQYTTYQEHLLVPEIEALLRRSEVHP